MAEYAGIVQDVRSKVRALGHMGASRDHLQKAVKEIDAAVHCTELTVDERETLLESSRQLAALVSHWRHEQDRWNRVQQQEARSANTLGRIHPRPPGEGSTASTH